MKHRRGTYIGIREAFQEESIWYSRVFDIIDHLDLNILIHFFIGMIDFLNLWIFIP